MSELIEIWIVIAIAAVLVIGSLVLTSFAGARRHARREAAAFRWLGATNVAFLLGAMGLMLGQILPFWLSASMVILGMLLGLMIGYISLLIGIGENPLPKRYIGIALICAVVQGLIAAAVQDVTALVISSSLINGILGLGLSRQLWRKAGALGKELAILASAPFAAIGLAYLVRLGLVLLDFGEFTITVATLIITFLMAFSALQWGFALIAFRAARLNRSLEQARDEAEEASRLKSRFLANMSHELRTPLNGILGMTQALEEVISGPEEARMLETIRDSGEGLLATLNDILDLSKVQSGQLEIQSHPFDLRALAEKTALLFGVAARAKGVGFEIEIKLDDGEERFGDEQRVRQILGNLLSNAVKFTEIGEVRCLIQSEGVGVCFRIEDTGIGMTELQQTRIFDEFVQADASITRRFGGTGLGMPIVRELALSLGGTVAVESVFGEGTTVVLRLPLPVLTRTRHLHRRASAPQEIRFAKGSATTLHMLSDTGAQRKNDVPLRVLVAEDNKVNQKVFVALLRSLRAQLTIVDHGGLAVEMSRSEEFDLFLFDAMMPVMDGVSALREITADYVALQRPMPPAVVVTANVAPEQIEEYLTAGFLDVVAKPISKARLMECLSSLGLCEWPVESESERAPVHLSMRERQGIAGQ